MRLLPCLSPALVLGCGLLLATLPAAAQESGQLEFRNAPWTGDFDGMLERRLLRALVVPSRTGYFLEEGIQYGASYDGMKAFEDEINRKYKKTALKGLKFHVVFIPTSRDNLIPALLAGKGDVALAQITITPKRLAQIDFSEPTARNVREIVVTGPNSPAIATLDDLAGNEVFTRKSSSYWEHLEDLNRRFKKEGKEFVKLRAAPEELEDEDLLEMLNAGLIKVVVVDRYLALLWAQVLPDIRVHENIEVNAGGDFGWMMRKNSPKLKAEVDAFVKTHGQGTLFGNTIIKKYAGSTKFVKNAASPEELAKYQKLVDLFRKYAGQYKLDYLLMMAQGYQESRLDHGVKSPVGAVGVMQIMPATGTDLKVGDINQLEPNIHGGVKYVRDLIDRYYANEPMTEMDKVLFAFASYNAGRGRISQIRKQAAEKGLDANVWLHNVEVLAPVETRTYVSNIFKYYIAYKLVSEEEEERRRVREEMKKAQ
ncbi:MAG TPA: lytic transglycosylase F [Gammaproteobacteria bacterium]